MSHGADINAVSSEFGSPICFAALKARKNIFETLLSHRALLEAGTDFGSLAHAACCGGDRSIVEALQTIGFSFSVSRQVNANRMADIRSSEILALLEQLGARMWMNCLPIHVAAFFGHIEIVEFLLESGSPIRSTYSEISATGSSETWRTEFGYTLLMAAAYSGSVEMITLLIGYGVEVNARTTKSGATALWIAAALGRASAIPLLIDEHSFEGYGCKSTNPTALAVLLECAAVGKKRERESQNALQKARAEHDKIVADMLNKHRINIAELEQQRRKISAQMTQAITYRDRKQHECNLYTAELKKMIYSMEHELAKTRWINERDRKAYKTHLNNEIQALDERRFKWQEALRIQKAHTDASELKEESHDRTHTEVDGEIPSLAAAVKSEKLRSVEIIEKLIAEHEDERRRLVEKCQELTAQNSAKDEIIAFEYINAAHGLQMPVQGQSRALQSYDYREREALFSISPSIPFKSDEDIRISLEEIKDIVDEVSRMTWKPEQRIWTPEVFQKISKRHTRDVLRKAILQDAVWYVQEEQSDDALVLMLLEQLSKRALIVHLI